MPPEKAQILLPRLLTDHRVDARFFSANMTYLKKHNRPIYCC